INIVIGACRILHAVINIVIGPCRAAQEAITIVIGACHAAQEVISTHFPTPLTRQTPQPYRIRIGSQTNSSSGAGPDGEPGRI
ncbi:MAG: hypothetical protein KDI79_17215, partial [Anaerolineae bacterium]|nr:hypothetical protein [Anaerolineae bacterium]